VVEKVKKERKCKNSL